MLSRELRHRRSSLPGILEDTRILFKESLREQEKKQEETRASSSSSSSSSRRRPQLKSAASSPNVGRGSQDSHPPKLVQAQAPVHAPTPISSEHRKRRTSLPNGLEAAVKSPSHALWLPHPNDQQESDHPTPNVNDHSPPHPNGFPSPHLSISSQSQASGHSRQRSSERLPHHSASYVQPIPQTPRRYEPSQLPPHLHEQPNLHGRGLAPPPPVTFMNQVASPTPRPVSQITTSTQRSSKSSKSSKSSPPEKRPSPLALPAPPLASPNPPAKLSPTPSTKQINEPATPRQVEY
ncbi:hypothetical protein RhiJN_14502 [Ceratobasidium sp. AG-Ba]|nr:hypothetical protein RhiJN_14502 [Ceratobasidium sp. AG-Ba]QRW15045.1 hypothetical protein RhiLY_14044 [Ceratobasidium sp. AG-Ba]